MAGTQQGEEMSETTGLTQSLEKFESEVDQQPVTKTSQKGSSKNQVKWIPVVALLMCAVACIGAGAVLFHFIARVGSTDSISNDQANDIYDYVLPNATVFISTDTNSSIAGQFLVNEVRFEFSSSADAIQFEQLNPDADATWTGFGVHNGNGSDSSMIIILFHRNGGEQVLEFSPQLAPASAEALDEFMQQALPEMFVELSLKLASSGHLGSDNRHIEHLHRFAQWIWRYGTGSVAGDNDEWHDISDEFDKVNDIVAASRSAGFWIETVDDLDTYSSNGHRHAGRSLLGNCGAPYTRCGNACFGRCGGSCSCWSWVCGDCDCWLGCEQHDYFCSCVGMSHSCCVNVFWVRCDGSGTCS